MKMSLRKSKALQACVCVLLFMVLLLSFWTPIAKADYEEPPTDLGTMTITGYLEDGTFVLSQSSAEDLFDLDGAIYPGGTWQKTIRVDNTCPRSMEFGIISVEPKDEATMLFDALSLKIETDGEVIYEGPYGAGSEEDPISKTYRIYGRKSMQFVVTVALAADAKNALQGNPLESVWNFGATYNYPAEDAEYYVYYEDEAGNELHERKVGVADIGDTVTEQAIEIDGYTPKQTEQSLKIKRNSSKNVITFVYKANEIPVVPDEPITPDQPDEPQKPDTPQTGYDLSDNRMTMLLLCSCMALFLIAAVLVVRKVLASPQKKISDSNTEEEAHHDE